MILYQTPQHKHIFRHVGHIYKPVPKHWWQRIFYKPESLGRLLKCECGALFYAYDLQITKEEALDIGLSVFENHPKEDFGRCLDQIDYNAINELFTKNDKISIDCSVENYIDLGNNEES